MEVKKENQWDSLSIEEIQSYSSQFLDFGWRNQEYKIREILTNKTELEAIIEITKHFVPEGDDGLFALSNTIALPLVFQLGVIHSLSSLSMKKSFPVWSREFSIESKRKITSQIFKVKLQCFEKFISESTNQKSTESNREMRRNFRYTYEIDNGSFCGKFWLVFRPNSPSVDSL